MLKFIIAAAGLSMSAASIANADDMFQGTEVLAYSDGPSNEIRFSNLSPDVMEMAPGDRIDLNFGPGYSAELDRIDYQAMGARTWIGRIEGGDLGDRVIISELNGIAFGRIATAEGVWEILPGANGGHRIIRHPDNAVMEDWGDDAVVPTVSEIVSYASTAEAGGETIANAVPVGSNGTIDIAVVYSQSMMDTWGIALGGRIQYLVALLDQALIDSDTGLRARLVHVSAVSASETASNSDTLYDLQDGAGSGIASDNNPGGAGQDFSALLAIRDAVGADLVALIRRHYSGSGTVSRSGSGCGLAFINGSSSDTITPASAPNGVSVISDFINGNDTNLGDGYAFCSPLTLAHEIGHNLGFAHNLEDTTAGNGVRDFAHGHRVDCEFRTIMSYGSDSQVSCPGSGPNEAEVTYFSNPDITSCPDGAACGIAAPSPDLSAPAADNQDPADNARAAREEGLNVANFRAEAPQVHSSVLPIMRSVQNGEPATAFATIINPAGSGGTATGCGLRLAGSDASTFTFQTTTPANALDGTANTPVDIAEGQAQNFLFAVTSATSFNDNTNSVGSAVPSENDERDLFIEAFCANRRSDQFVLGLNTLTFASAAVETADIIALAATVNSDGWVNVPTDGNMTGIAAVAITNVGQGAVITASADTGGRTQEIESILLCGTDAAGACVTSLSSQVNAILNTDGVATFAVFVRGNGNTIPEDPANNRIFIRFNEGSIPRGATSVAVRTQ
ncbi:M12 family metallo-peptidase [Hyphobacterium sp. HN65]|uniref:M12 family metallo-peptidase n=1 Tax=Hyphobacterium lacteum TaxID=3116575 RepID=A0ABU7LNT7_9PROT|nr:M12 family metallo-peptidase [Hyphobacterium sp. HN65]MEE2525570.1 M12 family metallo-peptidase [Hyphobacterium sp. HN65]